MFALNVVNAHMKHGKIFLPKYPTLVFLWQVNIVIALHVVILIMIGTVSDLQVIKILTMVVKASFLII